MITINGRAYSGNVLENDNGTLSILVKTIDTIGDIVGMVSNASEVREDVGDEHTVYGVSAFKTASCVKNDTYIIEFSTTPSFKDLVEAKLKEQSDTIDELLLMALGD